MKLTSSAFNEGASIPAPYTCDGAETSPPLSISEVPAEAKGLVLIMDDPDAPGGTWDHWVVFNISPTTREILEGQEPAGIHGRGTSGGLKYQGPCPPDREHRYFFKVSALDTVLDLPEGVSKKDVEQAIAEHILTQVELMGRYERQ